MPAIAAKIVHIITVPTARPPLILPNRLYINSYRSSAMPLFSKNLAIRTNRGIASRSVLSIVPSVPVATILRLAGPQSQKATERAEKPIAKASGAPVNMVSVKTPNNSRVALPGLTSIPLQ
jgi:hypothetical protein